MARKARGWDRALDAMVGSQEQMAGMTECGRERLLNPTDVESQVFEHPQRTLGFVEMIYFFANGLAGISNWGNGKALHRGCRNSFCEGKIERWFPFFRVSGVARLRGAFPKA